MKKKNSVMMLCLFLEGRCTKDVEFLDYSGAGNPSGFYPLYQVIVAHGSDPLGFTNWVGGLSGLSIINYNIESPVEVTEEFDNI